MNFQKMVLTIAIILLLVILVVIGVSLSKAEKTEENEFSIKNTNIKLEHAKAVLRDIESF